MRLRIDLTSAQHQLRAGKIRYLLSAGSIHSNELDSMTSLLSSPQTSVFGRYGGRGRNIFIERVARSFTRPTYRALMPDVSSGWEGALRPHVGRYVAALKTETDLLMYTDEATDTMIMAGMVSTVNPLYEMERFLRPGLW